jgi:hypothetical protein
MKLHFVVGNQVDLYALKGREVVPVPQKVC